MGQVDALVNDVLVFHVVQRGHLRERVLRIAFVQLAPTPVRNLSPLVALAQIVAQMADALVEVASVILQVILVHTVGGGSHSRGFHQSTLLLVFYLQVKLVAVLEVDLRLGDQLRVLGQLSGRSQVLEF